MSGLAQIPAKDPIQTTGLGGSPPESDFWKSHPEVFQQYARIKERIDWFDDTPEATKERAWSLLGSWLAEVEKQCGKIVPPPMVFGSRQGTIEFEWETEHRDVWLTVGERGPIEYSIESRESGHREEQEGSATQEKIAGHLAWLVGASWTSIPTPVTMGC